MNEQESDKEIWLETSEGGPGQPITLYDFIKLNKSEDCDVIYSEKDLKTMRSLKVGQTICFNLGAGGLFGIMRVENPLVNGPIVSVKFCNKDGTVVRDLTDPNMVACAINSNELLLALKAARIVLSEDDIYFNHKPTYEAVDNAIKKAEPFLKRLPQI